MDQPGRPAQLHFRVPLSRHAGCIQALRLANERARIAQGWVEVCVVLTDLEQVQVARAIADTLLPLEAEGAEASGGGQRITLARLAGILDCYAKVLRSVTTAPTAGPHTCGFWVIARR